MIPGRKNKPTLLAEARLEIRKQIGATVMGQTNDESEVRGYMTLSDMQHQIIIIIMLDKRQW